MDKEQLRDHLAGLAMQTLLSKSDASQNPEYYGIEIANICKWSYIIADQMLHAKIKKQYVYDSPQRQDTVIRQQIIQETRPDWAR